MLRYSDGYHTADRTQDSHELFQFLLHYAVTPDTLIARTAC